MICRVLYVLAALLWAPPAFADQIDVVLKFANLAAAQADPIVQSRLATDTALLDVKLWRPSQDVNGVHTYLADYYVLVSLPRVLPALRNHLGVILVINRDKANARQQGAIVRSTFSAADTQDLRFSRVFAGADYPFGAWSLSYNFGDVAVGAIRWDAWYHPLPASSIRLAMEAALGPSQYQFRAPFCADSTGADSITIGCGQDDIDREIIWAADAGLRYWAFVWYSPTDNMQAGWRYFQASPHREKMNWCFLFSGAGQFLAQAALLTETIGYLRQANYQTVMGGRPLIYFLYGGESPATVLAALESVRAAAIAAGLPNPYVVVLSWVPADAASRMDLIAADAIGAYAQAAPPTNGTYAQLDSFVRAYWPQQVATGKPVVPIGMTGWDRRPRIEHPVPWESWQIAGEGINIYYATATPAELVTHIGEFVEWSTNNPDAPSGTGLVYAWNEHDEGGWLNPTLGDDASRLEALQAVLQ